MYFDARIAKQLQPGHHIVVDGCLGLRLEASNTTRSWTYRYKSPVDGHMRQMKLGKWPAMPVAAAVVRWNELKDLRGSGVDPALRKRDQATAKRTSFYSLGDVVDFYVKHHLNINRDEKGAKQVKARLEKAISAIAKTPAEKLTRKMAYGLINSLIETPVLAKSVKMELAAAWEKAMDAGELPEATPNWWSKFKSLKLESKGAVRGGEHKGTAKRVLSDREIGQLLTDDFPLLALTVRDILTLYLWTAVRGGEIVQMHAKHITEEPDGCWWTMPKQFSKNRNRKSASDLRVPLVGRALEVVERRLELNPDGYLFKANTKTGFTSQCGMQSQVNFRQPYCNSRPDINRTRLTVTHWSPHDLRRTARSMLAAMGCPREVAESILGHVLSGVEGIYNQYRYDEERRDWLQRWSNRIEELMMTYQSA